MLLLALVTALVYLEIIFNNVNGVGHADRPIWHTAPADWIGPDPELAWPVASAAAVSCRGATCFCPAFFLTRP
jgi:hypothetical protein